MSEETVIRCCAPTLAAIKTGSLFNCAFESRADMTESLRAVNRCLAGKGARMLPLRWREGKALLLLYRPKMLESDLSAPLASEILRLCGYPEGNAAERLTYLMRRVREDNAFPHEIGLFLGYPPADVRGFMEGRPCRCTGLWKVFESDEAEAQKYFARCKNCTRAYLRRSEEGWSLSRLTLQPRQFSYKKYPEKEGE
ncbi:MAG: DUF3793 family protein [Clostridia bacterium]|nr:DUF3793 family protein [Clostridia bacterium]